MEKRINALLIVCTVVLTGLLGCDSWKDREERREYKKITVAVSPWTGSTALYVALEKDLFREQGLGVTLQHFASGLVALSAALEGKADLATVADTPIARCAIDGKPVAVVATIDEVKYVNRIIARKDHGISSPKDLIGKTVGVPRGTNAEFFLHVFLTTSFIDPADIHIINIEPHAAVDALLKEEVDAVCIWGLYSMIIREKLGDNGIDFSDSNLSMSWNIAGSKTWIENNPGRVIKFLRAIVKATTFIHEHPGEALAITSGHIGAESPFMEKEWPDNDFQVELDQSLILNLEDQARWMIKKDGGDESPPDFLNIMYVDGLKAVLPEEVRIVGK
jgi:NitT/TauT family transport system substrate-binding protein